MEKDIAQNELNIAITEVLYIIKHFFSSSAQSKVSDKFIKFLEENSIQEYSPEFDTRHGLNNLELNEKTKSLLGMVYRDYLCTEEEKKAYDKLLLKNEEEYQNKLREKYNPDNLFKEKESKTIEKEVLPIEVQKDSLFKRIINKIKKLLFKEL